MSAKGVKDPKSVIQGEIHFEQNIPGMEKIPARVYTGREWQMPGQTGPGMGAEFGPGKPNHLQTAALEDWMNKANGVGGYTPLSGKPTTPSPKVTVHRDPAEAADMARARVLRRKLAGEPNPLGKSSPSALQIAGRANPGARSEAARLAGFPDKRGKDFVTKRERLGVEEGGYIGRPEEQVVVPSKTTPAEKPRFIPKGKLDKRRRPDRMH
jgi:hypothetical protein